jgi:hypothetical protein
MSKKNKNKKQGRGHPNRRRPASSSGMSGVGLDMLSCYARSLTCPFDSGGCRLGWGTLFPTELGAAWLRTTLTSAGDGSLAIVVMPDCANLLQANAAGLSTATWSTTAASNQVPLANNFAAIRPVSLGVRARPNIAMTSAPGRAFAGSLFQISRNQIGAFSPQDLINLQTSKMFPGFVGVLSTGRPSDTTSFEFLSGAIAGVPVANLSNFSCPYIVWSGLPASTPVDIEVMFNFEGVPMQQHGLLYSPVLSNVAAPALSDLGSVEQIQKILRPRLLETVYASEPAPGSTPEGAGVSWANSIANAGTGIAAIGGAGLGVKNIFNRARNHARNVRNAGYSGGFP